MAPLILLCSLGLLSLFSVVEGRHAIPNTVAPFNPIKKLHQLQVEDASPDNDEDVIDISKHLVHKKESNQIDSILSTLHYDISSLERDGALGAVWNAICSVRTKTHNAWNSQIGRKMRLGVSGVIATVALIGFFITPVGAVVTTAVGIAGITWGAVGLLMALTDPTDQTWAAYTKNVMKATFMGTIGVLTCSDAVGAIGMEAITAIAEGISQGSTAVAEPVLGMGVGEAANFVGVKDDKAAVDAGCTLEVEIERKKDSNGHNAGFDWQIYLNGIAQPDKGTGISFGDNEVQTIDESAAQVIGQWLDEKLKHYCPGRI
jgi:hypothetical protein